MMLFNRHQYKTTALNLIELSDKIIWFIVILNLQYLVWQFNPLIIFPWLWLVRFPLWRLNQWFVFSLASLVVDTGLGWPLGLTWVITIYQQLIINYLTLGSRYRLKIYQWSLILVNLSLWWLIGKFVFGLDLSLIQLGLNNLIVGLFLYYKLKNGTKL